MICRLFLLVIQLTFHEKPISCIRTLNRQKQQRERKIKRYLHPKMTQRQLASDAGVSVRFIADLERGKSTVEIGKAHVLACLGITLKVDTRLLEHKEWNDAILGPNVFPLDDSYR